MLIDVGIEREAEIIEAAYDTIHEIAIRGTKTRATNWSQVNPDKNLGVIVWGRRKNLTRGAAPQWIWGAWKDP